LREERRKTLGDSAWGKPGFPHEPPPFSRAIAPGGCGSRRAKPGFASNRLGLRT